MFSQTLDKFAGITISLLSTHFGLSSMGRPSPGSDTGWQQLLHPLFGGFPKSGVPFWGPIARITILFVHFGFPLFWETTISAAQGYSSLPLEICMLLATMGLSVNMDPNIDPKML